MILMEYSGASMALLLSQESAASLHLWQIFGGRLRARPGNGPRGPLPQAASWGAKDLHPPAAQNMGQGRACS